LQEDMDRILKYPDLFSTFYNIDPPNLGISAVYFLHRVWATLTSLYPRTIHWYATVEEKSIWTFIAGYRQSLSIADLTRISDFNLPIDFLLIANTFGAYASNLFEDDLPRSNPLWSILLYEWSRAIAWMQPEGPTSRVSESTRVSVELHEAGVFVPVVNPGVEFALLEHDVSTKAVLDRELASNRHAHIFVPRGGFDYSELEISVEMLEVLVRLAEDPNSIQELISDDLVESLNELAAVNVMEWRRVGSLDEARNQKPPIETNGVLSPFEMAVAPC
ncbi:MAG: hypothetical protein WCH44_15920, partial [Betaproteobacteria bacterium]